MPKKRQFTKTATSPGKPTVRRGEVLAKFINDSGWDIFQDLGGGLIGYEQAEIWAIISDGIAYELPRLRDQGVISSERAVAGAIVLTRIDERMAVSSGSTESALIRQCACGCATWFLAYPRHKRYCSPACRNKVWEQRLTEDQKERRRDRMKRFMSGYYDKNFKHVHGTPIRPSDQLK